MLRDKVRAYMIRERVTLKGMAARCHVSTATIFKVSSDPLGEHRIRSATLAAIVAVVDPGYKSPALVPTEPASESLSLRQMESRIQTVSTRMEKWEKALSDQAYAMRLLSADIKRIGEAIRQTQTDRLSQAYSVAEHIAQRLQKTIAQETAAMRTDVAEVKGLVEVMQRRQLLPFTGDDSALRKAVDLLS